MSKKGNQKEPEFFNQEILERDEKIQQLEKQLSWYKSFFDKATDAVFIIQPETWSVMDANDYAGQIMGIVREDLLGTNLPQFRRIFKLRTSLVHPSF